eukprot:104681_1
MAKSFLCFNCKPRQPKWGENAWEIILTTVTILLFVLSIVEIIALAQYSSIFSQSEVSACCGVIEEFSFGADGAFCHEQDIKNSHIEKAKMDDGSVFCVINDEICDVFEIEGSFSTDLETCLTKGGFALTDVCGEELINEQASHIGSDEYAAAACIGLLVFIFSITFFGISEYIGCFEDSCWCQNKAVNIINKILEIAKW